MFKKNFTKIFAATALIGAVASSAQAAAILVTTPITISFAVGGTTNWNIDGSGNIFSFTSTINAGGFGFDRITFDTIGGGALIRKVSTKQLETTPLGTVIDGVGYTADSSGAPLISISTGASSGATPSSTITGANGFTVGVPANIAFTYLGGSGTMYGWAELLFSDSGVTVNKYAYSNVATDKVGDGSPIVPEPSSYALAASVLTFGLVGARRLRKRSA